ncbi:hypothetical protein BDZ85DRAFT_91287 [Elsinoe ampelina]|uniref:Uncharacterized protein n=1 Tax=Elsinoe ampelina TaxID=302913 RepID=A0A6A6GIH9_9PEZI|nr:hypothetical protein BDZ85DRAFT_91287 [Elsinoe ampelina]
MCSACRFQGAWAMAEYRIWSAAAGAIHRVAGRHCRYPLDCRRGPPMTSDAARYHAWLSVCNTTAKRMWCACRQNSSRDTLSLSCHSFEMALFFSKSFSLRYHICRECAAMFGLRHPLR